MNTKIYIDEIPDSLTVADYLKQKTYFPEAAQNVKPKIAYPAVLAFEAPGVHIDDIELSIERAIEQYGEYGWQTKDGVNEGYTGFSLTHNPFHQDNPDMHASTLGTPRNASNEFFWSVTKNHQKLKNSYFDTYGFCVRTPASKEGVLGSLLDSLKRTLVRSRLSTVHGRDKGVGPENMLAWHRDETIFENLRINIPVATSLEYLFQIEGKEPAHLARGFFYSWDTHIAHRVFSGAVLPTKRTHIVLGVSPWFDYLAEERAWVANEFFGKMHPFDMLREGHVLPGLQFRPDVQIYN